MTVGIEINYSSSDPFSNYLIDFDDRSIVAFPQAINSPTVVYHTFPQSGYYNVNVTVYNQVSSKSAIVLVRKILGQVSDLFYFLELYLIKYN